MKYIVQYQIETAICMALFTLFYLLLWRKETNFQFKRLILLSIPFFSIIIPLINLNIDLKPEQESATIQYITYIPNQLEMVYTPIAVKTETMSPWEITFWILSIGAIIMFVRILISYLRIMQIYRQSKLDQSGEFRVIDDPVHSFSFFNMIMINRSQALSNKKEYILAHERAHKKQGHSWDILWLELIKMLHWFNPMIWLLSRESKKNLEYLADQEVAESTGNIQHYQFAIVQHASQNGYQLLKTQFSKTNLRNRIIMMNQPNNQKINKLKLLFLIPVLGALLLSFSVKIENFDLKEELVEAFPLFNPTPIISAKSIEISSIPFPELMNEIGLNGDLSELYPVSKPVETKSLKSIETSSINGILKAQINPVNLDEINYPPDTSSNAVFTIVEHRPRPSTGDMESYYKKLKSNLKYPKKAKKQGIKGKVFVEFIVQKDGTVSKAKVIKGLSSECDAEAIRAISEGPKWIPGEHQGKIVDVRMIMPVPFGIKYPPPIIPIKGKVTNTTGEPLVGCKVVIEGTKLSTITDQNGIFQIKPKPGIRIINLLVSYRGYKTKIIHAPYGSSHAIELKKTDEDNRKKISGIVKNRGGEPIPGVNILIKGSTIGTITDLSGKFLLKSNSDHRQIVVSKVGYKIKTLDIVDGKKYRIILERDPSTLLPSQKTMKEGSQNDKKQTSIDYGPVTIRTSQEIQDSLFKAPPLFIVDGKEMIEYELADIDPNDIESMSVSRSEFATEKYGEKGKNGVILIETKNGTEKIEVKNEFGFDEENPPLIIIDGKEAGKNGLYDINPNNIESMNVLKGESAASKYGEKAKNGVIIIHTRSHVADMIKLNKSLDKLPAYEHGMEAFYDAVRKRIKYPKEARTHNVQGRVLVSFTVTKNGFVKDIKADETEFITLKEIYVVGYSLTKNDDSINFVKLPILEEEVINTIKQLDDFAPGIKDGKPVDVRMTLPVVFKLD